MHKTYAKTYKLLIKENEEDQNKWGMSLLSKLMYTIPAKIPSRFFIDIEKIIVTFILKSKRNIIAKAILKKKNKVWEITVCNFKTHYIAIVISTVWYWYKCIDRCNRLEDPEIVPHKYTQLVFYKGAKAFSAFSINGVGEI